MQRELLSLNAETVNTGHGYDHILLLGECILFERTLRHMSMYRRQIDSHGDSLLPTSEMLELSSLSDQHIRHQLFCTSSIINNSRRLIINQPIMLVHT